VASGPRLKLDPVDLSPGRNPGLKLNTELQNPPSGSEAQRKAASELWAALNTPPEKAAEDARRLAAMEADLKALRDQQASLQASVTALTAQLQAERDERAPKSLLYALAGALALAAAALAWLVAERRRVREVVPPSDLPWWQSVQQTDAAASVPAPAAAAVVPVAVSAAPAPVVADDHALAAVQVNEATESSFAQLMDDQPVSVEALLDLVQQVEFFESLQQRNDVTMVLEQFVHEHPTASELPYLLLMQQAQAQRDAQRLSELCERFEQAFGAPAPDASAYTPGVAGLETQAKFMDVLTRFWPEEQVLGLLRNTLLAPPGTGLLEKHSLQAFEDALLLYSVAHTLQSDGDLRGPGAPAMALAAVAPSLATDFPPVSMAPAPVTPVASAAPAEAASGLDLDLSFTPEHEIPAPAEAPVVASGEGPASRDLPMLDFDLFGVDNSTPGQPPAKS
jgi:pilus assembly protein FimV